MERAPLEATAEEDAADTPAGDGDPSPEALETAPPSLRSTDREGLAVLYLIVAVVSVGIIIASVHLQNFKAGVASVVAFLFMVAFLRERDDKLDLAGDLERVRIERDVHVTASGLSDDEHGRARAELNKQLETQTREHGIKVDELTQGHATLVDELTRENTATVNRLMARAQKFRRFLAIAFTWARAARVRIRGLEQQLEFLQLGSVMFCAHLFWPDFKLPGGEKLSWKSATHLVTLAVAGHGCAGIWVRIPNDVDPRPFSTSSEALGVTLAFVRLSDGKVEARLQNVKGWSLDDARGVAKTSAVDLMGQAIIMRDEAALIIHDKDPRLVYRHQAIVDWLRAQGATVGEYFRKYALNQAHRTGRSAMRAPTMTMPAARPRSPEGTR